MRFRAELTVTTATKLSVTVRVEFARDERLGVWAPSRMDERYGTPDIPRTTCTAKYSNYRRFETSARIVSPK